MWKIHPAQLLHREKYLKCQCITITEKFCARPQCNLSGIVHRASSYLKVVGHRVSSYHASLHFNFLKVFCLEICVEKCTANFIFVWSLFGKSFCASDSIQIQRQRRLCSQHSRTMATRLAVSSLRASGISNDVLVNSLTWLIASQLPGYALNASPPWHARSKRQYISSAFE